MAFLKSPSTAHQHISALLQVLARTYRSDCHQLRSTIKGSSLHERIWRMVIVVGLPNLPVGNLGKFQTGKLKGHGSSNMDRLGA